MSGKLKWRRRRRVFRRDNYICQYCGRDLLASFEAYKSRTVDHFIPVLEGRDNDIDNLVCCCAVCNVLKSGYHAKSIEDAIEYIKQQRLEEMKRYKEERKTFRPWWKRWFT